MSLVPLPFWPLHLLGDDGFVLPRHCLGLPAGWVSRVPASLQLYFISHQQDLSPAVSGQEMDVDSCLNSLCETRLFSSEDEAFQTRPAP